MSTRMKIKSTRTEQCSRSGGASLLPPAAAAREHGGDAPRYQYHCSRLRGGVIHNVEGLTPARAQQFKIETTARGGCRIRGDEARGIQRKEFAGSRHVSARAIRRRKRSVAKARHGAAEVRDHPGVPRPALNPVVAAAAVSVTAKGLLLLKLLALSDVIETSSQAVPGVPVAALILAV